VLANISELISKYAISKFIPFKVFIHFVNYPVFAGILAHLLYTGRALMLILQCFGSGSAVDSHLMAAWIGIRIPMENRIQTNTTS
jgi:hypothetical protein